EGGGGEVGEGGGGVGGVAVGRNQGEGAVVIEIEKGYAEAESVPARQRQAELSGVVAEDAVAQVLIEGRILVVEIRDGQVGQSIAVQVAASHPHARRVDPGVVASNTGEVAGFFEAKAPPV